MHFRAPSFVILITSCIELCGAWVNPFQYPFSDQPTSARGKVHGALVKGGIIPDVLDDFQPSVYLSLSYASNHKVVGLGNKIKPKKVTSPPVFNINALPLAPTRTSRGNTTYTLVFTDPDATSRAEPVMAQMCHWIVTNLSLPFQSSYYDRRSAKLPSFLSIKESNQDGVEEIMPYLPPTPPPRTGYHRYVFVLLASETKAGIQRELTKPKDRPHWGYRKVGAGVREWADENGLVVVGANFFYSKNKIQ